MSTRAQQSGMRGVYLVAAQLAAQGLIVSPTSRSAFGADLLVTDAGCQRTYSVQVKTNGRRYFAYWLVGAHARRLTARSHVYVFVNLRDYDRAAHEFFVVPARMVARLVRAERHGKSVWYTFQRSAAWPYLHRWDLLGGSRSTA